MVRFRAPLHGKSTACPLAGFRLSPDNFRKEIHSPEGQLRVRQRLTLDASRVVYFGEVSPTDAGVAHLLSLV